MLFRDVAIHFSGYFDRHDPEMAKIKEINKTTSRVESAFLSYMPKKIYIAELCKLNINFGPKDPRENQYWVCDGIGNLNKGAIVTPDEIINMSDHARSMWAIDLIEKELCLLAETAEVKKLIKYAAQQTIKSDFSAK